MVGITRPKGKGRCWVRGVGCRAKWGERRGPNREREERSERETIGRGGGEPTGPAAADPGPPKSKFTIVCSSRLRCSFSVYPWATLPLPSIREPARRCLSLLVCGPFLAVSSLVSNLSLVATFFFHRFLFRAFVRQTNRPAAPAVTSDRHPTPRRSGEREKVEGFDTLVSDSGPLPRCDNDSTEGTDRRSNLASATCLGTTFYGTQASEILEEEFVGQPGATRGSYPCQSWIETRVERR